MIPLSEPELSGNEWKYIKECLDANWVSSAGSYVDLFEARFREYVGSQAAVVTMNGTAALALALQTLGVGPGDEVIVPSMTFSASVNPVLYVGATPVFADITGDTWVMDTGSAGRLITKKTKAVMPVHLYGNMVDMDSLMRLAENNGLFIVEDATEALGSEYLYRGAEWKKAGTIGDFGAFSFNGNKVITTGAGGMLVTGSRTLGEKAKYLSNQAKMVLPNGGFAHRDIGYNYRMPNILAAMGVAQLEKLDEHIAKKKRNALFYNSMLREVKGLTLPAEKSNIRHSQWMYSVLVGKSYPCGRDALIDELKRKGISSRPFFYPLHEMPPYAGFRRDSLEVTQKVSSEGINLPSSVGLKQDDIALVCDALKVGKK